MKILTLSAAAVCALTLWSGSVADTATPAAFRNSLTLMMLEADDAELYRLAAAFVVIMEGRENDELPSGLAGADAGRIVAAAQERDAQLFREIETLFRQIPAAELRATLEARAAEPETEPVPEPQEAAAAEPEVVIDLSNEEQARNTFLLAAQSAADEEELRDYCAALELLRQDPVVAGLTRPEIVQRAKETAPEAFAAGRAGLDKASIDDLHWLLAGDAEARFDERYRRASLQALVRPLDDAGLADFMAALVLIGQAEIGEVNGMTAAGLVAAVREAMPAEFADLTGFLRQIDAGEIRRQLLQL